jgi:hypothetical protein
MPLWVKRKTGVKGPFSKTQIEGFIETGRLPDGTLVSESPEGPWQPLTISHNDAFAEPDVDSQYELQEGVDEDVDATHKQELWASLHSRNVEEAPEKEPAPRKSRKPLESNQDVRSGWTWILSIDTKEFNESKLLNYHNAEYPALAAAIRYYAVVTKVLFYVLTILWFLSLLYAVGALIFLFVSATNSAHPVEATLGTVALGLPLFTIIELILLISVNLFYVLSIAGCEAAVAFLSIEKILRTSSTTEIELP